MGGRVLTTDCTEYTEGRGDCDDGVDLIDGGYGKKGLESQSIRGWRVVGSRVARSVKSIVVAALLPPFQMEMRHLRTVTSPADAVRR